MPHDPHAPAAGWRLDHVDVDGTTLAYAARGDGIPIVCLHATGHAKEDFSALGDRVAGPYRWIAVDWPGQGASGRDHRPASATRYAELLARLLDALGLDAPILLGNSIGGAAAIRCAADHPTRVRALVLANPGGLAPVDAPTRAFCRMMTAFFRAGTRRRRWFRPAFALYYRTVLAAPGAHARRAAIVAGGYDVAPVLAEAWASFARPEADLRRAFAGLRCPVLLAWATGDRVVTLGRARAAIASLPHAELHTFRGGHAAFLEDPAAFDTALGGFLDRVGSAGVPKRRQA